MSKAYEYNKAWRDKNRDVFNEEKKRNYAKSRDKARNGGKEWSKEHDRMVLNSDLTDRELGERIGRSAQAIQLRRGRLKRGEVG